MSLIFFAEWGTNESFPNLAELELAANKLQGLLPSWGADGALVSLQILSTFDNNFSGPLPVAFENLVHLRSLDLSNCRLTGVFLDQPQLAAV